MRILKHNAQAEEWQPFTLKAGLQPIVRSMLVSLLISGLLVTTGCRGCLSGGFVGNQDDVEEKTDEEKEKEKEKKPDFISRTPVLLPGYFPPKYDPQKEKEKAKMAPDVRAAMEEQNNSAIRYNRHKLGHWVEAHLSVIANNFNADGRLRAVSVSPTLEKVPIPSTDYYATTQRPVALTKGEWKNLEISVFLPRRDRSAMNAMVEYDFDRGSGGVPFVSFAQGTALMKPFQYHVVILSERPDSYNFLKLTDSIQLRGQQFSDNQLKQYYYVVPSLFEEPIPLPRQSMNWTTIAYLIWDDYDPEKLSRDQQEALLDWLHFGGQLILSGPDCLSKLQNGFLANYLPAQFNGSKNLVEKDFTTLNQNWALPLPLGRTNIGQRTLRVSNDSPLLGVSFNPHQDAQFVAGTGELLIERQVGRGRIMISSFSLIAPAVRKWPSFQSFVNGAILRRPAREFVGRMNEINVRWADDATSMYDPLIGSTLRYLSRDLSTQGSAELPTYSPESDIQFEQNRRAWYSGDEFFATGGHRKLTNHHFYGGYQDSPQSGVAGWNDDSGISNAARETLLEAAGIVPPSSAFVLKMLAIYLSVLVPLNWLVFRLIGRVEWAWIAAPFIAIAGAIMVVKMASLDIGFVRSNTQVGIIEIHANYPRAHVAEYSALYTSLSTNYDVELDNPTAQSLPFATVNESEMKKSKGSIKGVTLKRTALNRLEGFPIQSNSTGMLHTEFMLDLEGTLDAIIDANGVPQTINNGTIMPIQNAGIVRCDEQGKLWLAWVGDLPEGVTADLKFEELSDTDYTNRWRQIELFESGQRRASALWTKYFDKRLDASQPEISKIEEISQDWDRLAPKFKSMIDPNTEKISRESFERAMGATSTHEGVQIGRLFDVLSELVLSPGEVRLIGSTDQRLGRTKFSPEATRNDRQTLVVVHLRRPQLPSAKRDRNSPLDFMPVSNLDWEREVDDDDDEE